VAIKKTLNAATPVPTWPLERRQVAVRISAGQRAFKYQNEFVRFRNFLSLATRRIVIHSVSVPELRFCLCIVKFGFGLDIRQEAIHPSKCRGNLVVEVIGIYQGTDQHSFDPAGTH
jgi:hypothetical protein